MTIGPVTSFPAVNSFSVGNFPMPGKWTLTSATKLFGWQIQQGYGLSGAVVLPTGDKLIVAKFKGQFWDIADFAVFGVIRKQLLDRSPISFGGIAVALGVTHPELKALGVASVVVLEVNPVVDTGGGLWETTLDLLQYRPPKIITAKPDQVIPDAAPAVSPLEARQRIELQKAEAILASKIRK